MIQQRVMHILQTISYSLIVLFTVAGCASFDDFLEIPLEQAPLVLFQSSVSPAENNTLVLLGIDRPYVYEGVQAVMLDFYLDNENTDLSIINGETGNVSNFLPFVVIDSRDDAFFSGHFPQLKDLSVFGIFLEGMNVDKEKIKGYKILADGSYRNISTRNAQLLNDKEVLFVVKGVERAEARLFRNLVNNTFALHR